MAKITYADKDKAGTGAVDLWRDVDANEVKTSVNSLYDNKLDDVTAGANVTIDKTNPLNPVISAASGGGGIGDDGTVTTANANKLVSVASDDTVKASGILASKLVRVDTAQTFTSGEQTQARDNIQAMGIPPFASKDRFAKFTDNAGTTAASELTEKTGGGDRYLTTSSAVNLGIRSLVDNSFAYLQGGSSASNGARVTTIGNTSTTDPGVGKLQGVGLVETARWDTNNFKITSTTGALVLNSYANVKTDIPNRKKGMVSLDGVTGVPVFCDGTNWKKFDGTII